MRNPLVSGARGIGFHFFVGFLTLGLGLAGFTQGAAIRVANWNVGNLPNTTTDSNNLKTVLGYIGTFSVSGTARPVDILTLAETDTTSLTSTVTAANSQYGVTSYTSAAAAADGAGDRTGFVFNSSTVSLVSSSTLSGGSLTHNILRGRFRPSGTSGSSDFYLYAVHLKSGATTSDEQIRKSEAQQLRSNADGLGSANVIFAGDFNWNSSDELGPNPTVSAWDVFAASGTGQVSDPVNAVGNWRDNATYKRWHTNDPGAAMDDRFDMQLISGELKNGSGLDYINGSYTVIANNGTHTLNGAITTGSGATSAVRNALFNFSDHLPVIADYSYTSSLTLAAIPEPSGLVLLGLGAIALVRRRR